ncbi:MAG: hypothetical protein GX154_05130 [Clostridiales bacterium]|nr:hypothetical protein [Clostridiales bacterium]
MSRGKQQFLIFMFGFIVAGLLSVGGYFLYNHLLNTGRIQDVSLPVQQPETPKMTKVLIAIQGVGKGDELKPEYFELKDRPIADIPLNSLIDVNMIEGKRAASVIDANSILTDSMLISPNNLYDPEDRLKDYALQGYLVANTVKAGDWIDIELVRSNGDTFTVLSKKQVTQLIDNKAIIKVTTNERHLINHAIAEQSAGMGHIESLLYLDESQPASEVNYVPEKIADQQIKTDSPGVSAPAAQNTQQQDLVDTSGGKSR